MFLHFWLFSAVFFSSFESFDVFTVNFIGMFQIFLIQVGNIWW